MFFHLKLWLSLMLSVSKTAVTNMGPIVRRLCSLRLKTLFETGFCSSLIWHLRWKLIITNPLMLAVISAGYECGAGQPLQQQAEETAEAAEICRMFGQKGNICFYILFSQIIVKKIMLNSYLQTCINMRQFMAICVAWTFIHHRYEGVCERHFNGHHLTRPVINELKSGFSFFSFFFLIR